MYSILCVLWVHTVIGILFRFDEADEFLSSLFLLLLHHHAGCNVHGHQLLEEQLGGVGQLDLGDLGLVLAALALEGVVPQVGNRNQAAEVADVNAVRVGHLGGESIIIIAFTKILRVKEGTLTIL